MLIVASHPDDEILGCGATTARLIKEGCEAETLILGENGKERNRWDDMVKANNIIGVTRIKVACFPDNQFDTVPMLHLVKMVESEVEKIKPDTIFTHFRNDLNVDHRLTYQAVLTATRPMKDCPVKTIYSFEIPSSTEWNYPTTFSPNVFFDIYETFHLKREALEAYVTEIRENHHPRSDRGILANSVAWGLKVGCGNVEAFELVRQVN